METDNNMDCFAPSSLAMTAIIWDSSEAADCFTPFAMTAIIGTG
jgi:hypothetical protein